MGTSRREVIASLGKLHLWSGVPVGHLLPAGALLYVQYTTIYAGFQVIGLILHHIFEWLFAASVHFTFVHCAK